MLNKNEKREKAWIQTKSGKALLDRDKVNEWAVAVLQLSRPEAGILLDLITEHATTDTRSNGRYSLWL